MADSTEHDALILYLGFVFPAIIALIPGLVIHSFIIGINVNDWWKGRSVTSIDHIVTSLGISRMCAQCTQTIALFLQTFLLSSQGSQIIIVIIGTLYSFLTYSNIWLTSLLSIVFCLKISNLRTRLFLYLRRVILPRTGHFIAAIGLLSAFSCLIHMWIYITEVITGGTNSKTLDNKLRNCSQISNVYTFCIGSSIPLLFYFISSVLLFASLYHHTVKMKRSSNLSINLETYYSAMKFVFLSFIYFNIYLFSIFAAVTYYSLHCLTPKWLQIIMGLLPSLHSTYLICRTAKLWNQMSKILQNVTDFFFSRKSRETKENIEPVAQ